MCKLYLNFAHINISQKLGQINNILNQMNNFGNENPLSGFQGFPVNQPNIMPQQQPGGSNGESERDRRIRLRDQERQRRNQTGSEGLAYGAAQMAPPQMIRPPQQAQGLLPTSTGPRASSANRREQIYQQRQAEKNLPQNAGPTHGQVQLPIQQNQQQQFSQHNEQAPAYQPMQMAHLQNQINKIQNAYGVPGQQSQGTDLGTINDRDFADQIANPAQAHLQPQFVPMQLQIPQPGGMQDQGRGREFDKPGETNPLRRSSKSKLNFEQAKQLDTQITTQQAPSDGRGLMQIGQNNLDELRRDQDKKARQQEYQQFLIKQQQQKQRSQISPGRIKDRLNSARKYSQQVEGEQHHQAPQNAFAPSPHPLGNLGLPPSQAKNLGLLPPPHQGGKPPSVSPNTRGRKLMRSNSSYGPQNPPETQGRNILGQPMQPPSGHDQAQNSGPRAGSAARAGTPGYQPDDPLLQGGLSQIGDPQMKAQEEKLRKQREYREFLDMQKNQVTSQNITAKPPASQASGRPPSGTSFIAQGKSINDQGYLEERRRQLSDQVFSQLLNQSRPGSASAQKQYQAVPQAYENRLPTQAPESSIPNRLGSQQRQSADPSQANNMFHRNQMNEEDQKIQLMDKQKQYAMELQQQIAQKNSSKQPRESQRPPQAPPSSEPNNYPQPNQFGQAHSAMPPPEDRFGPSQQPQSQFGYPPGPPSQHGSEPGAHSQFGAPQPLSGPPSQFGNPPPSASSLGPPNQFNANPHVSQDDERFQAILREKKEQYKRELDEQMRGAQLPSGLQPGQPPLPMQPSNMLGPPMPNGMPSIPGAPIQVPSSAISFASGGPPGGASSEADVRRMKIEEYKRELDAQMKSKQGAGPALNQAELPQANQGVAHALPGFENQQNQGGGPGYNKGGRGRSDITSEKQTETSEAQQKKAAYQEELRIQMEQAKAKKEAEKAKLKLEEEKYEIERKQEMEKLKQREIDELRKEGKSVDHLLEKENRAVNQEQFMTSAELAEKEKQKEQEKALEAFSRPAPVSSRKADSFKQAQIEEPIYKPFSMAEASRSRPLLPTDERDQPQLPQRPSLDGLAPPSGVMPRPAASHSSGMPPPMDLPASLGAPLGLGMPMGQGMPPPFPQGLSLLQAPTLPPQLAHQPPESSPQQQKLLDDQAKMIGMYQQALGQILDFRNQYFKEAMDMQMNLMKEREQIFSQGMAHGVQAQQQQSVFNIPGGQSLDEYNTQAAEIQKLKAVKETLGALMGQAQAPMQAQGSYQQNFTPIMNPQVQNNLNTLIKSQRDQIIRMSQSIPIREDIKGIKERSPTGDASLAPQFEMHRIGQASPGFDESLKCDSKLISVPNQFKNKLMQKAEGFEQQRLNNLSPRQPNANMSGHDISPRHSPTGRNMQGSASAGLYQTWKQHPETASINDRGSPIKGQQYNPQNPMQASLAGSSHLQFMNNSGNPGHIGETPNHERMFSPIPHQNANGLSPNKQMYRPPTNLVHPQDTIQELPEKEGNMDNTNDYEEEIKENQIVMKNLKSEQQRTIDRVLNIQHNKHQSIETDVEQDFNNRDEQMTSYSKSIYGRKSKVSQGKSIAQTEQMERQMASIENQVNLGKIDPGQGVGRNNHILTSHQKSPFQSAFQQDRKSGALLSPGASSNNMVNIGHALAGAGQIQNQQHQQSILSGKPLIPTSTEKSFYKPSNNLNHSHFAQTGMQGAPKPTATGSSFYNATMAKTKQQEQNQQEELQRQLMKIFSPENGDADSGANRETIHREDQTDIVNLPYKLPLDNTEDLENMSNINIAQSVVGQSMEYNHQEFQPSNMVTNKQIKSGAVNMNDSISSNLIAEQYNWHLKNGDQSNGVINEQEFESKSRSQETSNQQTQRQNEESIQSQTVRTQSQIQTQRTNGPQKAPNQGEKGGQEDPLCDDSNMDINNCERQTNDDLGTEIEEQLDYQFEGTQRSQLQEFEVVDADSNPSRRPYDPSVYQSRDQPFGTESQNTQARVRNQPWLNKPSTAAQPYTEQSRQSQEMQEENEGETSTYNIADTTQDDMSQPRASNLDAQFNQMRPSNLESQGDYIQLSRGNGNAPNLNFGRDGGLGSGISNLNLGAGLFSQEEPATAHIVQQDSELLAAKRFTPSKAQFQSISDPDEKKKQNEEIDQMYDFRQSQEYQQQQQYQAAINLQNRLEDSRKGLPLNPIEQSTTSDIYPPQMNPHQQQQRQDYNPNFSEVPEEETRDEVYQGGLPASQIPNRDVLLDSTPNCTPGMLPQSSSSQLITQTGTKQQERPTVLTNKAALFSVDSVNDRQQPTSGSSEATPALKETSDFCKPNQDYLKPENEKVEASEVRGYQQMRDEKKMEKQVVEEESLESLENKLNKIKNIFNNDFPEVQSQSNSEGSRDF